MQPVKAEFKEFVQFTDNIPDRLLDFQITQAYSKSLVPKFGDLATAIKENESETIEDFLTDSPELATFYRDFLREYWITLAYRRFISVHGINVSQFGLTRTADPEGTFVQATGDDRAIVIRQISSDLSVVETNIYKRLKAVNWTFDTIVYNSPDSDDRKITPKKNFGIRPIGGGNDTIDDELNELRGLIR